MQCTPPVSPSASPTPGSSDKGASNRTNQDQNTTYPPPHEETIRESDTDSEPGEALFDNKYAKYSLEEIKISWNGASCGYGKAKKKYTGFIPHFFLHSIWKSRPA